MRSVSILIPIEQNLPHYKLSLESAIKDCGLSDIEILLFFNGQEPQDFLNLDKGIRIRSFSSDKVMRNSEVLNKMLLEAEKEYICIIPDPSFLPINWLFNMVCSNAQVNDTGITAIGSVFSGRGSLTPKMNQDEKFEYVYQTENNQVKGVWLFHRVILDLIGGFDPELNTGYEYLQFSHRISKHNLANYYLVGVSAIDIAYHKQPEYLTPESDFLESLKFLAKRKNYFYKIIPTPDSVNTAMPHLPGLMEKFKSQTTRSFYLELSESWGFDLLGFSQSEVKHLDQFCQDHNLEWIVLPPKVLDRGMSINFFDK